MPVKKATQNGFEQFRVNPYLSHRASKGHGGRNRLRKELLSDDKGQKEMVRRFLDTVRKGKPRLIGSHKIETASLITLGILESLQERQPMDR